MLTKCPMGPEKAIKYILFLGVLTAFFPFWCNAVYINFDGPEYVAGELNGQNGWTGDDSCVSVSADYYNSSAYSAKFVGAFCEVSYDIEDTEELTPSAEWYFYLDRLSDNVGNVGNTIYLITDAVDVDGFRSYIHRYTTANDRIFFGYGNLGEYGRSYPKTEEWIHVQVQFDFETQTAIISTEGSSLAYASSTYDFSAKNDVSSITSIELESPGSNANEQKPYIDDIEVADPEICSEEHPEYCWDYSGCQMVGGWWHYNYNTHEYECAAFPEYGVCGEGIFSCQYCDYSECAALSGCYWTNNICGWGSGICGPDYEVLFCENEEDCVSNGGYWYNEECNFEAPATITSWEDYYDQYGDSATPTEWVSNMASGIGPFFENLGGFAVGFQSFFDPADAYEKGATFGSAIPIARSYLAILNESIFAGYPIGEFFLFVVGFYVVIGIFRMTRNLFQLIKFW